MKYQPFVRFGGGTIGGSKAAQILEEKIQLESEKDTYKLMKIIHKLNQTLNELSDKNLSKPTRNYILRLIRRDINERLKEVKSWLNFDSYSYYENVVLTRIKIFERENKK